MTAIAKSVKRRDEQTNSLRLLADHGQSIWLDYITRELVRGGQLQRMIEQDGLGGMTSNPTIFQKAIADSADYDDQIKELTAAGKEPLAMFEAVAVRDIQDACDLFMPLYERTAGADGFVSIEVPPTLANNTEGTIDEGRKLWKLVNRPNVMIKVPGTDAGAPAIKQLLSEGINVNVTLLFSLQSHERVMWRYIEALEERVEQGLPINRVASVASFFVSRVDALLEELLEAKITQAASDNAQQERLRVLLGKGAIANAKLAYARFEEIFGSDRFQRLQAQGARVQRVLWASTSTKNPDYSDVLYIEELIGPHTVNTSTLETMGAFQDHGEARRTIDEDVDAARNVMQALADAGIDYDQVTQQLEDEGVDKFVTSFEDLLADIEAKCNRMR